MIIQKMFSFLLKNILKIGLLPILILILILQVIVKNLLHIGSFGITGIVLIGIYAITVGAMNGNWELIFAMGLVSVTTIILVLAAGIVVALVDEMTSRMISFMFS